MKKSKVLIPAMALLLFSTAASITGTVAWFTANRTFAMTAGEFAVINTKNNLACVLAGGVGTEATTTSITTKTNYILTDASFDHTETTHNIVIPNEDGDKIARIVALANADEGSENSGNHMFRQNGTGSQKIFSAFTWNLTFTVTFAAAETQDLGLFLDLSSANTYVHEKFEGKVGDDGTGVYTDAKCTAAATVDGSGKLTAAGTYYKVAPDDTGKAFRLALVPTNVSVESYGVTKVWAKNQTNAKSFFIDGGIVDAAVTTGSGTAYGTATTKATKPTADLVPAAETAGSGKVLMASGDASAIPADLGKTSTTALSDCSNYLGYFKNNPGDTATLTYTAVAWYEGTDENITTAVDTIYETVVVGMEFGTAKLNA
ncbi:MAG: hypothetical protein IJS52_07885 [Bacilli bacterium]|nr:hypothetical protein [Bacilli bacterium]